MLDLALLLVISIAFIGFSLYAAWEKPTWRRARIGYLIVGVFWLPVITIGTFIFGKTIQSWEWLVVAMTWLASLLVLGLCLMWSKKIHAHGRLMIILTLAAIALLLGALALRQ